MKFLKKWTFSLKISCYILDKCLQNSKIKGICIGEFLKIFNKWKVFIKEKLQGILLEVVLEDSRVKLLEKTWRFLKKIVSLIFFHKNSGENRVNIFFENHWRILGRLLMYSRNFTLKEFLMVFADTRKLTLRTLYGDFFLPNIWNESWRSTWRKFFKNSCMNSRRYS